MFESYKYCLFNNKTILKNNKDKSDHHEVYTEENNKIVLSSNGYKRLQTFEGIETYPHRANPYIVCKSQMMISRYFLLKNTQIVRFILKQYQNDKDDCFLTNK